MAVEEFYDDPAAPAATRIAPAVQAVVLDADGRLLLEHRSDNGMWGLPGGMVEVGETVAEAVAREVMEETGLEVVPQGLVGVYSDPRHVAVFADGEVRQEFSLTVRCVLVGGRLRSSEESLAVGFFSSLEAASVPMHVRMRLRVAHAFAPPPIPYLG